MSVPPTELAEIMRMGPVIAVVTIERAEDAGPLADALCAGGIRVVEVTLRSNAALAALERLAARRDLVLGAGTLRRAADVRAASAAGAQFLVSPGFTDELHDAVRAAGVPWLPGVATPSEILRATAAGLSVLKFFPAEAAGGAAAMRAYATVFPEVGFCPTGGITLQNARAYLALPNVRCVGASWVAPSDAIDRKDWHEIQMLASRAAALGTPR